MSLSLLQSIVVVFYPQNGENVSASVSSPASTSDAKSPPSASSSSSPSTAIAASTEVARAPDPASAPAPASLPSATQVVVTAPVADSSPSQSSPAATTSLDLKQQQNAASAGLCGRQHQAGFFLSNCLYIPSQGHSSNPRHQRRCTVSSVSPSTTPSLSSSTIWYESPFVFRLFDHYVRCVCICIDAGHSHRGEQDGGTAHAEAGKSRLHILLQTQISLCWQPRNARS